MIQQSLVEYINAQMKLGVSRDAVKASLVGVGWNAGDVEDTLKSVESAKASQPIAAAASAMPVGTSSMGSSPAAAPMGVQKVTPSAGSSASGSPAPQVIRVSDLVSAPPSGAASTTSAANAVPKDVSKSVFSGPASPATAVAPVVAKKPSAPAATYQTPSREKHGAFIAAIVFIVLFLAAGGFAGFLYVQNHSLTGQLASLNSQAAQVNSQLSALQNQILASTTALNAQTGSLAGKTEELQTELSFYAIPPTGTPGVSTTAMMNGTVNGGGKEAYVITGTYGAKIVVLNSKDASVIAALTPLVGTTTVSQFSGTYAPGSGNVTLTEVNGTSLQ
jgi:hypothetical protein